VNGDIKATGSVQATGTGLTLSCINKAIQYSLPAGTRINLQVLPGAGSDTSTTKRCGAGYEVFQSWCVSSGGSSTIHLSQAGSYGGSGICTFYNAGSSAYPYVYIQARCCKGSW
jgi:hypothetical protein